MAQRTLVKVCGLTRLADARVAHDAGADWLGVILKHDGVRRIPVGSAREIVNALDGAVVVGVMVKPTPDEAFELASHAGAQRVQIHGVNPLEWPNDFPLPIAFAIPVAEDGALTLPLPDARSLVLLDTAQASSAGGTGRTFPWHTARVVAATRDVLLAGGLSAENVGEALDASRPFGVDASSRLESAPGIKDETRVRAFVQAVREWDANKFREERP